MIKIIELEEVDSTNNYAKSIADSISDRDFVVVNAIKQTAGRGQGDHLWESSVGENITFSCVFKPRGLRVFNISRISQAVSLGISDFIMTMIGEDIDEQVKIKWPNDIYVGDRKIVGILIENIFKGEYVESSVIGVGLNVNQTVFPLWLPNPTSLKMISGKDFDINEMLLLICNSIYGRLLKLDDDLKSEYLSRLYKLNDVTKVTINGKKVIRKIMGVDDFGELITADPDGL